MVRPEALLASIGKTRAKPSESGYPVTDGQHRCGHHTVVVIPQQVSHDSDIRYPVRPRVTSSFLPSARWPAVTNRRSLV